MNLITNLTIFYVFSPLVEAVVASAKKYILMLIALSFLSEAVSVFSCFEVNECIPTQGLSVIVMGLIGYSAYMMPRARICTEVGLIAVGRKYYMPIWILAVGYIVWDIWDYTYYEAISDIKNLSQLSGVFVGYMIGLVFFREHKRNIQDDIDDAIEEDSAARHRLCQASLYSGGRRQFINEMRRKESIRDYERYMSRIYVYVQADRDGEAVMLIVEDYDIQHASIEIYHELFDRMMEWGISRSLLCVGRLVIDLHVRNQKYLSALKTLKRCHEIAPEFVLADSAHIIVLAKMAIDIKDYELAWLIVRDSEARYGCGVDKVRCKILEAELACMYLDKKDDAKELMVYLLSQSLSKNQRTEVLSLARAIQYVI